MNVKVTNIDRQSTLGVAESKLATRRSPPIDGKNNGNLWGLKANPPWQYAQLTGRRQCFILNFLDLSNFAKIYRTFLRRVSQYIDRRNIWKTQISHSLSWNQIYLGDHNGSANQIQVIPSGFLSKLPSAVWLGKVALVSPSPWKFIDQAFCSQVIASLHMCISIF